MINNLKRIEEIGVDNWLKEQENSIHALIVKVKFVFTMRNVMIVVRKLIQI